MNRTLVITAMMWSAIFALGVDQSSGAPGATATPDPTMQISPETAAIEPVKAEKADGIEGFRLLEIPEGSLYEKLGFKKGDVVVSYNEHKVTSQEDIRMMSETLRGNKRVAVRLKRDGKFQTLRAEIRPKGQ